MARKGKAVIRRKEVRREKRIAVRVTQDLFDVLKQRADEELKAISVVVVEALRAYLNFKTPPKQN